MESSNRTMMAAFLPIFGVEKKAYIGDINRGQEMHLSRLLYSMQKGEKKNLYRILPSKSNRNSVAILVTTETDGEMNLGSYVHIFEMRYDEKNRPYLFGDKGDKNYSMSDIFDRYKDMENPIAADYSSLDGHKCMFCYN